MFARSGVWAGNSSSETSRPSVGSCNRGRHCLGSVCVYGPFCAGTLGFDCTRGQVSRRWKVAASEGNVCVFIGPNVCLGQCFKQRPKQAFPLFYFMISLYLNTFLFFSIFSFVFIDDLKQYDKTLEQKKIPEMVVIFLIYDRFPSDQLPTIWWYYN